MAAIVRGQYEEEEDQRREQVDENDEGPKHGESRVRSLRVELGKRVSQAVQEEEERDCRQQEGYGQENWEGENSRVKAFLPERFFLGLHNDCYLKPSLLEEAEITGAIEDDMIEELDPDG